MFRFFRLPQLPGRLHPRPSRLVRGRRLPQPRQGIHLPVLEEPAEVFSLAALDLPSWTGLPSATPTTSLPASLAGSSTPPPASPVVRTTLPAHLATHHHAAPSLGAPSPPASPAVRPPPLPAHLAAHHHAALPRRAPPSPTSPAVRYTLQAHLAAHHHAAPPLGAPPFPASPAVRTTLPAHFAANHHAAPPLGAPHTRAQPYAHLLSLPAARVTVLVLAIPTSLGRVCLVSSGSRSLPRCPAPLDAARSSSVLAAHAMALRLAPCWNADFTARGNLHGRPHLSYSVRTTGVCTVRTSNVRSTV